MIDDNNISARYLKMTVTATEKTGLYAAIWNIKIYNSLFEIPLKLVNKPSPEGPGAISKKQMLINIDLDGVPETTSFNGIPNKGTLGGVFAKSGELTVTKDEEGIKATFFVTSGGETA
jgi:hypothetical protein